jgi:hypothetical protein
MTKIYRSDDPTMSFAKAFTGGGKTWTLSHHDGGTFSLSVYDNAGAEFHGWALTRDQLTEMSEMIQEALGDD